MEPMIAICVLGLVVIAQLVAMSRKPRDVDREHATLMYKEMHKAWMAGREFGFGEQQATALETDWSTEPFQAPLQDDVPYDTEQEEADRGEPAPVEVTEAPKAQR